MQPWWHNVVELVHGGRQREAIALTRRVAANGDLAAKVRLAVFGAEAGLAREQADLIVEEAEKAVTDDDETTHWVLRGAYDLGLGQCEYEEKSRRVLKHLEAFARATANPMAVIAVARTYATGSIGVPADLDSAVEWYYFAIALGDTNAARELHQLHDA